MTISFRPLSYALGAEAQGVDLSQPLSNSEFDQIHSQFLERGILLFRGQKVSREQHIAFSRRFGELDRHDSLPRDRHPDYPELLLVTNIPEKDGKESASKYTGQQWHSDMSFTLEPSLGSLLRGIITDNKSPLMYGYAGSQIPVYYNQSPVLNAGGGGFGDFAGGGRGGSVLSQNITPNATPQSAMMISCVVTAHPHCSRCCSGSLPRTRRQPRGR